MKMELELNYICKKCRQKLGQVSTKDSKKDGVICPSCGNKMTLDLISDGFRINF